MNGPVAAPGLALALGRLRAAPATRADADALQACLEDDGGWHLLTSGGPAAASAARDVLEDAEADDRRAVLALRAAASPLVIGFIDLHLDHAEPGVAHLGLLLLRPRVRGGGLGRQVVDALEAALPGARQRALRLSVVDEDPLAGSFWQHLGYAAVGRLPGGVTVYEKALPARGSVSQHEDEAHGPSHGLGLTGRPRSRISK